MINSVSSKMQTLIQHLASPCSRCTLAAVANYSLFTILFALLISCYREPLELYYDGRSDVQITYDWESVYGDRPDGMTLMLAHDGDSLRLYPPTHNIDITNDLRLPSGHYLLTVMNKSFGEYSRVSFYNRNSHRDIHVKSKTYYVQTENFWDNGRTYLEEPEKMGVAVDTFDVSTVIDSLIFYDYRGTAFPDTIHIRRHEVIQPMTTTLRVRVKIRGISYMRAMEGYITGMADGFYLSQGWRTKEVGTIKLENWERDYAEEVRRRAVEPTDSEANVGWMTCTVETFGLPHGKELLKWRTPESNYIMLHFTLLDGRTADFAYQVGKEIRYVGDDGTLDYFYQADVRLALDLEIDTPYYNNDEVPIMPYSQPEGSGQFDAEVQPWGDDVEVDVPM